MNDTTAPRQINPGASDREILVAIVESVWQIQSTLADFRSTLSTLLTGQKIMANDAQTILDGEHALETKVDLLATLATNQKAAIDAANAAVAAANTARDAALAARDQAVTDLGTAQTQITTLQTTLAGEPTQDQIDAAQAELGVIGSKLDGVATTLGGAVVPVVPPVVVAGGAITTAINIDDPLIVDTSPQEQPKDGTGRDVNISMAAGTTVSWHVHATEGPDSTRSPGAKLSVTEFPITGTFEHPEDIDAGAITVVNDDDGFGATVTFTTNGLGGGSNAKQRTIGIVMSNGNESETKEVWEGVE